MRTKKSSIGIPKIPTSHSTDKLRRDYYELMTHLQKLERCPVQIGLSRKQK